jgi:hypothetical protein
LFWFLEEQLAKEKVRGGREDLKHEVNATNIKTAML